MQYKPFLKLQMQI